MNQEVEVILKKDLLVAEGENILIEENGEDLLVEEEVIL